MMELFIKVPIFDPNMLECRVNAETVEAMLEKTIGEKFKDTLLCRDVLVFPSWFLRIFGWLAKREKIGFLHPSWYVGTHEYRVEVKDC